MSSASCRFCGEPLTNVFCDLGTSPLSNTYLKPEQLSEGEVFFPLRALVCSYCLLVQLQEYRSPENIFSDYAYFSSYSDSWLQHAREYADRMVSDFGYDQSSMVIEIGSNDGYLLRNFKDKGIPILGIEPAANVAKVAQQQGIPTLVRFFGKETATQLCREGKTADLLLGNNVLAHVPALNDFVAGLKILLKPNGLITMEFPHLLRLIVGRQFDTIYHEHFSYFSFLTVEKVLASHGLVIVDVQELTTHGGSLRIFAKHADAHNRLTPAIGRIRELELSAGLDRLETYATFSETVKDVKQSLLSFLLEQKRAGKSVVGYGAPAKGNTLLNYCGIRSDLIEYTVDRSPHKQSTFLPGSRIPVFAPEKIRETRPDYVLILPWNLKEEIASQLSFVREWGGQLLVPIPEVSLVDGAK
jgi:2-polyprenyl-3-methyl-5-hydroxy-6-metoxy-1,4-benzoquinol methylase